MTEEIYRTAVIIGAGHAAGELATSLRDNGWNGRIILIGEEPHLPYHRPPLSKTYLSGSATAESLLIKPPATYQKANVEIISDMRVLRIDRQTKKVELANGELIRYDKLVLTTGGRPRPLQVPQSVLAAQSGNFHYLRTMADVDAMRRQFEPNMRLVIVGGGYIGLEVAAVAIKAHLKVTVLEAFPRVLARVTAPELSAYYERKHREAGVEIRTGVQVSGLEMDGSGDAVSAVLCADGTRVPADLVVVGIGLIPNTELAEEAELAVDNGILVNDHAQTSDPDIYAAGDCTNHPNASLGRRLRLESVPNALEQARTAAAAICGKHKPYNVVPWFWSDQYDLKLKMVGLSQGYDQLVIRGSMDSDSFSAFYLQDGLVLAADTINRPPEFMLAKRIIAEQIRLAPEQLADDSVPLKSLLPTS